MECLLDVTRTVYVLDVRVIPYRDGWNRSYYHCISKKDIEYKKDM